jgi:hypothetical protein
MALTGAKSKVAVQVLPTSIVNDPLLQSASPLHPAKTDPEEAVALRTTLVPLLKTPEQLLPQLIPGGELKTAPAPVPSFATVTEYV